MSDSLKNNICDETLFSSVFNKYSKELHNFLYYKFGERLNPMNKTWSFGENHWRFAYFLWLLWSCAWDQIQCSCGVFAAVHFHPFQLFEIVTNRNTKPDKRYRIRPHLCYDIIGHFFSLRLTLETIYTKTEKNSTLVVIFLARDKKHFN